MPSQTVKQQVLQAVEDLPEDTTFEQAMERIYFLAKVERGLAEADAGELIDHEEIRREFGQWRG
jgi:predicted transcriptional regulator